MNCEKHKNPLPCLRCGLDSGDAKDAAKARDPLVVGEWLRDMQILEKLGGGTQAVVYKVKSKFAVHHDEPPLRHKPRRLRKGWKGKKRKRIDTRPGPFMALKILRPEMASTPGVAERFALEKSALRAFAHANIVRMIDHDAVPIPWYTMPFVNGRTLRAILDGRTRIAIAHLRRIVTQLCHAVDHAHKRGYVHRDLKPENILIDGNWNATIIDYGLTKHVGGSDPSVGGKVGRRFETQDGDRVGTEGYAPPEQWDNRSRDADRRADVYALGVILYEMLTGAPPQTMGTVPSQVAPVLSDYNDIVATATMRRPEARYASGLELLEALKPVLQWISLKDAMAETSLSEGEFLRLMREARVPELKDGLRKMFQQRGVETALKAYEGGKYDLPASWAPSIGPAILATIFEAVMWLICWGVRGDRGAVGGTAIVASALLAAALFFGTRAILEILESRKNRRRPVRGHDRVRLVSYEGDVAAVLVMAAAIAEVAVAVVVARHVVSP